MSALESVEKKNGYWHSPRQRVTEHPYVCETEPRLILNIQSFQGKCPNDIPSEAIH